VQTFVILGGTGGVLAVLSGITVLARGIFRQVSATEANTQAIKDLTAQVLGLVRTNSDHETRIAVLEDRMRRHQ
jgi:hypothetical protein